MSAQTLSFHYGKHHQAYVNNLNSLIRGTEYEQLDLKDIIKKSNGAIFNNAAQVWNHTFFWESLHVDNPYMPEFAVARRIEAQCGSFEQFKSQFSQFGISLFGSGWVWLVLNGVGELQIMPMQNAGNPLVDGNIPLLVCDVWEHAYYLDYQNRRADYIENFWKIVNWRKVEERFAAVVSKK